MDIESENSDRERLNRQIAGHDSFFSEFSELDGTVYTDGAIPKLFKELTGLTVSVYASCDECVLYHVQGALDAGAETEQLVEAIRMGVIGGGSVTYPTARYAFSVMDELDVTDTDPTV
jgi:AhpD family alkylhydroperoxidase